MTTWNDLAKMTGQYTNIWMSDTTTYTCATEADFTIVRDYGAVSPRWKTYEDDVCDYCGNASSLRDSRGNCPSCGANRKDPR